MVFSFVVHTSYNEFSTSRGLRSRPFGVPNPQCGQAISPCPTTLAPLAPFLEAGLGRESLGRRNRGDEVGLASPLAPLAGLGWPSRAGRVGLRPAGQREPDKPSESQSQKKLA